MFFSSQVSQLLEGIDAGQLTGVNQAHKQIDDVRPALGAVKLRVLAMDDGVLKPSFTNVVVQRRTGYF